jgi:hypothetical protein
VQTLVAPAKPTVQPQIILNNMRDRNKAKPGKSRSRHELQHHKDNKFYEEAVKYGV